MNIWMYENIPESKPLCGYIVIHNVETILKYKTFNNFESVIVLKKISDLETILFLSHFLIIIYARPINLLKQCWPFEL